MVQVGAVDDDKNQNQFPNKLPNSISIASCLSSPLLSHQPALLIATSSSSDLGSGIWDLGLGILDLESGTWNPESGIWNLESGIWNLESEICDQLWIPLNFQIPDPGSCTSNHHFSLRDSNQLQFVDDL